MKDGKEKSALGASEAHKGHERHARPPAEEPGKGSSGAHEDGDTKQHGATAEAPAPGPGQQAVAKPDMPVADAELAQVKDRLLRLQADFDNFRKRTARERNEVARSANESMMRELLAVLDHLDYGLQHAAGQDGGTAFLDGLKLISDQLAGVLQKFGLSAVAAEGVPFDPAQHEAISHMPSEQHPEGTVIAQTRRGYLLGDRLLRPAMVIVSSGAGKSAEEKKE